MTKQAADKIESHFVSDEGYYFDGVSRVETIKEVEYFWVTSPKLDKAEGPFDTRAEAAKWISFSLTNTGW